MPVNLAAEIALKQAIIPNPLLLSSQMPVVEAIACMHAAQPKDVQAAHPAAGLMDARASCVLVVDDTGLVGLVTERDIVRLTTDLVSLPNLRLVDVMAHPVVTVRQSELTDVVAAIAVLQQHQVGYLPVLGEQEQIVGLLTQATLSWASYPFIQQSLTGLDETTSALALTQAYEQAQTELAERRQVEAALRHSEATKQAIMQAIPDLFIRTNSRGERLEFLSGGHVHVIYPDPDMPCSTAYDILPEALAKKQIQAIQKALATGQLQTYEQQIEVDHQTYWEEVRVAPLMTNEAIVMVRDITDRKQAEMAFQNLVEGAAGIAGENFFPQLVQYIAQILDVRYVMVATQDDNLLRSIAFWIDGQVQTNIEYCIENTPCNLAVNLGEYVCPSGVQRQFPTNQALKQLDAETYVGVALTDTQGGTIGCLYIIDSKPLTQTQLAISMLRVFAARVSAELERQQAIDALKHLNEALEDRIRQRTTELAEFKYALDAAAIVAITNTQDVITYVNDRFCENSGYTREEALGQTHRLINSGYHAPEFFAELWATIRQGTIWRGEIRNRTKHGTYYWTDMTIVPFVNSQGLPLQYLAIGTDITARKQAEFNAESLQKRLQFLLASSPAVIYTCNVSGNYGVTSISENVQTLLGYEPNEFLQDTGFWLKHLHPDDQARVLTELAALFEQGHHYHEYRFRHRDGLYRWMRDELRLIYDTSGHPIEIIGYFADITDLKQAELELQELTVSLQNAMEGIARLDPQGRYLSLNRSYANLCGYEPNELVGTTWQGTVHPDDIPLLEAAYQTMLERGKVEAEARGIRKDGTLFYKQVTMVTALDQQGHFAGHYCFLKDISDRKVAEENLKRQLTAIEAAIDGIAIVEGNAYTYLNNAHLEMFGYHQPEDLVGQSWTSLYSPAEIERIQREVFPVLLQQQSWQGEAIATRRDGTTFHEGLSLTLTESGALICVCRDITEQKQAEEKIRQANEQLLLANAELGRATRLKDEFLANMSHELRTPLNAILGMAEGLQEEVFGLVTEAQQRAVATVERSGRHLLELINDILDLSKIESGKLELQRAPVVIKYLCDSSLTFVRQLAIQKGVQLAADIPATLPTISVDERRIRQVLINLLNNAVKFTPEGGSVRLMVSQASSNADEPVIQFQVHDTGIGIAPDDCSKLFQPFVQIDSSLTRQHAGTGLGLSLVQQLTHLHGGTVTVTSQPGQGSCFTVQIPYVPTLEPPASALPPTVEFLPSSTNRTVLVIEDAPSAAEQTTRYLVEMGLSAIVHPRAEGALDLAIETRPALIILDILLPDQSGWDVLTQLQAHPQTSGIPVVVVSVMDERSQGMALGASGYLVKPVNRSELQALLGTLRLPIVTPVTVPKSTPKPAIAAPLILLAEDNAANVATFSAYLKNRGFQLVLAKDGEEAIALTNSHQPNLILMDIQMPKLDGFSAIRQIRATPAIAQTPIIALTALAMPSDGEKCIEAGANEYMTKPVKLKLLVETIQRFL